MPAPANRVPLATVPNLRDVGGWPAADGTVRTGQVFRSAALAHLAGDDVDRFRELGTVDVYDLRTAYEREHNPDRLPDGVRTVGLEVLADATQSAASFLGEIGNDVAKLNEALAGTDTLGRLRDSYRDMVRLSSAQAAYRTLYEGLAERERRPALVHCSAGKDRTGWAAAVLLLLLGVDEDAVREDYLQTNDDLVPALQPFLDAFAARGGDVDRLRPALGVREDFLDAALDEVRERFGSFDGYVRDGLGLTQEVVDRLRADLVAH